MKRRALFAALFGVAGLALPMKAQSKNACPVCGVAARMLKIVGMKRGYVTQHLEIGADNYGATTIGGLYGGATGGGKSPAADNYGATTIGGRPAMYPIYDREPVFAHRNEAGEIDWFLEDCQRCGCVFKVVQRPS